MRTGPTGWFFRGFFPLRFQTVQRRVLCRARRELSHESLVSNVCFDTAENAPCKVCPLSAYRLQIPQVAPITSPAWPHTPSTNRSAPRSGWLRSGRRVTWQANAESERRWSSCAQLELRESKRSSSRSGQRSELPLLL